jgi:NTE family protein
MKYDFDDKYFPKRLVFSGIFSPICRRITPRNLILFHRKRRFESQQQFLKMLQLKSIRKLFFLWQWQCVFLIFVLRLRLQPVNNFRYFYGYDFLSIAGNSYVKSTGTIDYEFYKIIIWIFLPLCQFGDRILNLLIGFIT